MGVKGGVSSGRFCLWEPWNCSSAPVSSRWDTEDRFTLWWLLGGLKISSKGWNWRFGSQSLFKATKGDKRLFTPVDEPDAVGEALKSSPLLRWIISFCRKLLAHSQSDEIHRNIKNSTQACRRHSPTRRTGEGGVPAGARRHVHHTVNHNCYSVKLHEYIKLNSNQLYCHRGKNHCHIWKFISANNDKKSF